MMSPSSLKKKLRPAKKAWKSFADTVDSKLRSFTFSKAFNVIKTHSHRLFSYCSLHFFRKRSLTTQPYRHRRHYCHNNSYVYQYYYSNNKNHHHHHHHHNRNFSPIYIDQLYSAEAGSGPSVQTKHFHSQPESSGNNSVSRDKERVDDEKALPKEEDNNKGKEKILYSIEDAWREVVLKSPQLRPVDDRAEEFISKFRQDMKLQKEKSILEFQEMLARGT